ncbi:hypothetical protein G4B88_013363 [Cannabis sativa]|uniref:RNase H type-1 domain-containing protein n=1 Tax=Cannabis sativa TaxID=3483 RepID=A0A7J6E278_CANSA|nr:hypothetical protein G4B88_013363 [Cannabis sativa]
MYAADCVDACYFVDASVLHSNAAELLAILTALEQAWKENFHSIILHSDSKIAVEALRLGELPLAWGSYQVFKKCLKFSAMLSVACVFVNRELNSLADQLAHQARVDHFSLSSNIIISGIRNHIRRSVDVYGKGDDDDVVSMVVAEAIPVTLAEV